MKNFSALLLQASEEEQKRTVCKECQNEFPAVDVTKHLCVHMIDSNNFQGLLWHIILNSNQETIDALHETKIKKDGPLEIKLLANGVEISFSPFFIEFHRQLDDMINKEAQSKAKDIISKFEDKFYKLFRDAEEAAKEAFPAYQTKNQED